MCCRHLGIPGIVVVFELLLGSLIDLFLSVSSIVQEVDNVIIIHFNSITVIHKKTRYRIIKNLHLYYNILLLNKTNDDIGTA